MFGKERLQARGSPFPRLDWSTLGCVTADNQRQLAERKRSERASAVTVDSTASDAAITRLPLHYVTTRTQCPRCPRLSWTQQLWRIFESTCGYLRSSPTLIMVSNFTLITIRSRFVRAIRVEKIPHALDLFVKIVHVAYPTRRIRLPSLIK